jgi:hypothetical protein
MKKSYLETVETVPGILRTISKRLFGNLRTVRVGSVFGKNPESVRTIFRTKVWKNLESGEGEGSDGSQDDGQR